MKKMKNLLSTSVSLLLPALVRIRSGCEAPLFRWTKATIESYRITVFPCLSIIYKCFWEILCAFAICHVHGDWKLKRPHGTRTLYLTVTSLRQILLYPQYVRRTCVSCRKKRLLKFAEDDDHASSPPDMDDGKKTQLFAVCQSLTRHIAKPLLHPAPYLPFSRPALGKYLFFFSHIMPCGPSIKKA